MQMTPFLVLQKKELKFIENQRKINKLLKKVDFYYGKLSVNEILVLNINSSETIC